MRARAMTFPELALIAATRGIGGVGLGLLLAGRYTPPQRRRLGWPLLLIGIGSTVPILARVLRKPAVPAPGSSRARAIEHTPATTRH